MIQLLLMHSCFKNQFTLTENSLLYVLVSCICTCLYLQHKSFLQIRRKHFYFKINFLKSLNQHLTTTSFIINLHNVEIETTFSLMTFMQNTLPNRSKRVLRN